MFTLDPRNFKGRDFISIKDFSGREIEYVIDFALDLKRRFLTGEKVIPLLSGRTLIMLFQKPSTRTRISFEVAMQQLGGHAIYLSWNEIQLARGESISDTARVFSRYADGIMARVFSHSDLLEMAEFASVPVINGLSDLEHPVQALSDLMTIKEYFGRLNGLTLAFVGDGQDNVLNSLMIGSLKVGMNVRVATPKEIPILKDYLELAEKLSRENESEFIVTEDPKEAVKNADVVYTDVWVSMGKEKEADRRREILKAYQINKELMSLAKKGSIFMHCLPAHKGEEVTTDVFESPSSIVWQQAENRLHLQKGLLSLLIY